jgi:hypothetical protein
MKKILFAVATLISLNSFASDEPVTKEVLKAFREVFGHVKNVKWSEQSSQYEAYFKEASIVSRIRYDKEGNILLTIRSYDGTRLPLLIQSKLRKAYPNRTVFGVTEISNSDEVKYEISLQDEKSWLIVQSDANGYFETVRKFKKG